VKRHGLVVIGAGPARWGRRAVVGTCDPSGSRARL